MSVGCSGGYLFLTPRAVFDAKMRKSRSSPHSCLQLWDLGGHLPECRKFIHAVVALVLLGFDPGALNLQISPLLCSWGLEARLDVRLRSRLRLHVRCRPSKMLLFWLSAARALFEAQSLSLAIRLSPWALRMRRLLGRKADWENACLRC